MTEHPDSQPLALVSVRGGARWGGLKQLGGNGLVILQIFNWGVQIGPTSPLLAKLMPPARLEWSDILSVTHPRSSVLRFERTNGVEIKFYGASSLDPALTILRTRGLIQE